MLSAQKDIPDEQARKAIASNIAKYMRTKSFEYNQAYPNNDIILKDIRKMSEGAVELTEDNINSGRIEHKQAQTNTRTRKSFSQGNRPNIKNNGKTNKPGSKRWQNRTQYK